MNTVASGSAGPALQATRPWGLCAVRREHPVYTFCLQRVQRHQPILRRHEQRSPGGGILLIFVMPTFRSLRDPERCNEQEEQQFEHADPEPQTVTHHIARRSAGRMNSEATSLDNELHKQGCYTSIPGHQWPAVVCDVYPEDMLGHNAMHICPRHDAMHNFPRSGVLWY